MLFPSTTRNILEREGGLTLHILFHLVLRNYSCTGGKE